MSSVQVAETPPPSAPPGRRRRLPFPALAVVVVGVLMLVVGGFGGSYQGKLGSVQKNDNAAYLPATAESTRVSDEQRAFVTVETIPGFLVYQRAGGLTAADRAAIARNAQAVRRIDGVAADQVSPPQFAPDGKTAAIAVPLVARNGAASVNGDRLVAVEKEV